MRKIYLLFSMLFASVLSMAQITLPMTFETGTFTWTNFDGGNTTVINNPQSVGINTSTKVAQTIKGPGGQPWGGSWIQLASPIDFSTLKFFRMKVFSTAPGKKVLLKVENESNGAQALEVNATTTKTNEWEDLSFNFSAVNMAFSYHKVVVIFELGTTGDGSANFTFLFDDIRQEAAPSGALLPPKMPVTFDETGVDKKFVDFDGGATTVIANPFKTGINTSDTVARYVKNAGAVWAGSKLILGEALDFTTKKLFKMKVYSPRVGAKMLLKVEGSVPTWEKEVATTKANEWEELSFDYTGVSTVLSYNQLVFILDLGTAGDGTANYTILFDDIRLEAAGGGGLTQMNLPVTFDSPTVDYGLIGFGGAEASSVVVDPTNAANKVAKVIKSATAELWAGTTVSAAGGGGFSSKIPFTNGNAFMNVRVWSPNAGIQVRLKVEDHTNPAISVETEATTTVANGWQNLVFNFANQAAGTSPINYANNYDKASIFFNFGVTGATAGEKTYYFDDMVFGAAPLPVKLLSFDAEKVNQVVNFAWTTTAEVNNKEFGVQRSETGEKWNDIAVVKGQGTAAGTYHYTATDIMPLPGVNFYRLRQTDLDGKSVYSKIRVIDFSGNATEALKVYPNPAKGRLNVISSSFDGKVGYTIVGADGRQVGSGMLQQTISATGINISNLKPGIYILKLQNEEQTKTTRFIVQ